MTCKSSLTNLYKIMVKAVIWDNDGVLVDTEKLYFKATREVFSEFGIDLTADLNTVLSWTRSEDWRLQRPLALGGLS